MNRTRLIIAISLPALALVGVLVYGCGSWGERQGQANRITQIGRFDHKAIRESSGIIASRKRPGVFWTHNDQGNKAAIYAITRDGELLATFTFEVRNDDWEDIAVDDAGHLYIAATGNNDGLRKQVNVLRVDEPEVKSGKGKLDVQRTWKLTYPEKPFDAEALFIHKGHGYLISKHENGKAAQIYRFPLDEERDEHVLEQVCMLPVHAPVTAADISADGSRLAVLSEAALLVFPIDGDVASAAERKPAAYRGVPKQAEGCCFMAEGILITAESRQLYLLAGGE